MILIALRHGGVPCALLAERAGLAESAPSCEVIELWSGAGRGATRWIRVRTRGGDRSLPCTDVHIAERGKRVELPALVKDALAAPFVTALVMLEGSLAWILDPGEMVP
jgi:hypothetical protein